jgi:PBSX family phage terminase large subunit
MVSQSRKTIQLHRAQDEFCKCTALYRAFCAGRGAGKTRAGAVDLIRRARRGRTYLVAAPTSVMLHDSAFPMFKAMAQDLNVWNPAGVRLSPYPTVELTTGATVRFRTADDPEKLRGPSLTGCWLDEASLMPREAYLIVIAALREAGEQGWLSCTMTPRGITHWTYDVFGQAAPNTAVFSVPTDANPFLPPDFRRQLEEQYGHSRLTARQELGGEFVALEGCEWPAEYFGPAIWFDEFPTDLVLKTIALDPSKGRDSKSGDYSAFVLLGRSSDGMLWCEADLGFWTAEQIVDQAIDWQGRFLADAVAIEANVFQSLLASQVATVSQARGIMVPVVPIVNTVNKQVRIRRLGPFLARGGIRFRNTKGTRLLVEQLRDFPMALHDDGPDACELALRLMIQWWNDRQQRRPQRMRA